MKHLAAIALLLLPTLAQAAPAKALFGTQSFAPARNHRVTGPLVQLKTEDGAILSFQKGAKFKVSEDGTVALTEGNLRIGPVASSPITLKLPQGMVTVAPNTALTVTASANKSTGRVYQGEASTQGTTFGNGQGFIITPSRARQTFTPNAAQAPSLNTQQATIQPAIAFTQSTAPNIAPQNPTQPQPEEPATEEPTPEEPTVEEPSVEEPTAEEPVTEEPSEETPQPTEPETTPETPTPSNPQPENPPLPEAPSQPESEAEPEAQLPSPIPLGNLMASFSQQLSGVPMPDNANAIPSTFRLNEYPNGLHELLQTETTTSGLNPIRLSIGTALQADTFSVGNTAGLGRWVGGELVRTANRQTSLITNYTTVQTEDDTTIIPNSLHYVWGEKATNIPSSGRVTYSLAATTQPTYTGTSQSLGAGSFTGNLSIDFTTPVNSNVGTYHFSGAVTMPQTVQTETGPTTTNVTYNIATNPSGVPLSSRSFANTGTLNVTAPTGALACPSGCTGTVNAAGFGDKMATVGTIYAINPTGAVGINGAALFTANP